jgi:hypothetical protein
VGERDYSILVQAARYFCQIHLFCVWPGIFSCSA